MRTDIAARFDRLEAMLQTRFETIDRRFDDMDQRFGAMDERITGVDRRCERIEISIREQAPKVAGQFEVMRGFIDRRFDDRAAALDIRFTGIDKRIARLEDEHGASRQ